MLIPIKEIILENYHSTQQERFGIVSGALNPKDLLVHNLDKYKLNHEHLLKKSQLGFAAGHTNSSWQGTPPTAKEALEARNNISILNNTLAK
jgi:hypothetical protein